DRELSVGIDPVRLPRRSDRGDRHPELRSWQRRRDPRSPNAGKWLRVSRFRRRFLERFRFGEDIDPDRYASAARMELARDVWNRRCDIERARAFFSRVATLQGGERCRHFSRGTFRVGSDCRAGWCFDLDTDLLAHPLCFGRFNCRCSCITAHHSDYNLAKSKHGKVVILLVGLSRGSCDLASSFKSFAAHAWNGAALYSKVKIGETAILGAGSWGTALAWLWGKDGRKVSLWGHNADRVARMRETRENSDYLPGLTLPGSVRVTSDLSDCARADLIVFATPSMA